MPEDSITLILDRNPSLISESDVEKLVGYYRERRASFKATGETPSRVKPKPAATTAKVDLDDLLKL